MLIVAPTQRGERANQRRVGRCAVAAMRQHVMQGGDGLALQTCGLRDERRLGGLVREVEVEARGGREAE